MMIKSYKKVLEMESVAELKLEQTQKALSKVQDVLYQPKRFISEKLIRYLKQELNINYFYCEIVDIDGNNADILVKENSKIFEEYIKMNEYLNFNVEELIDSRRFDNADEIIIIDLNFAKEVLNLGYFCDSLDYSYLSYSEELKSKLSTFVDYIINKALTSL